MESMSFHKPELASSGKGEAWSSLSSTANYLSTKVGKGGRRRAKAGRREVLGEANEQRVHKIKGVTKANPGMG